MHDLRPGIWVEYENHRRVIANSRNSIAYSAQKEVQDAGAA
jgi:hypothetical protein